MTRFLSKYSLKYPRSLVYMLQASEYDTSEFYKWFWRVKDFTKVEERKSLVKTLKSSLLYAFTFNIFIITFILAASCLWLFNGFFALILLLAVFLLAPYITLLLLILFNSLLSQIQKPIQKNIIEKAKNKLTNHKAIKIGIAGSFGKTTMKEVLKTVLSEEKRVKATPDNKNTPLGIAKFVETLDGDEEVLIFEMGEYYEGDILELCNMVNPDIGIITGVNEAHLDKFKSLEKTTKTIFELADFVAEKNGKIYVNGESKLVNRQITNYKNTITYDRGGAGKWKAEGIETSISGTNFVLKNNDKSIVARSRLLGTHQVGPLSVAAHLAESLGMKIEEIELGIKSTKPFEHRMETREESGGVIVIDDSYNGNPDGVKVAIEFLKEIKGKRRFYITPGLVETGDKKEEVHKNIGKLLAEAGIEKVVLIKNSVTPFIFEGLKENNFNGDIIWFDSALECFAQLPKQTANNDLLFYQNDWPDNYA